MSGGKKRKGKTVKLLYLLQFEDVLVEIVLKPFVGEVDTELFKTVVLIILKAKDVQHSYRQDLVEQADSIPQDFFNQHDFFLKEDSSF